MQFFLHLSVQFFLILAKFDFISQSFPKPYQHQVDFIRISIDFNDQHLRLKTFLCSPNFEQIAQSLTLKYFANIHFEIINCFRRDMGRHR